MNPITKTYLALILVFLAVFEFWAAMRLFGKKGSPSKHARLILSLHRIGGYIFLVFFIYISWVCVDMMDRLADAGKQFDSRAFIHGFFAMCLFAALLVKISFIRMYRNYRPYVPVLGIGLSAGTLVLWAFAGWLFLVIL